MVVTSEDTFEGKFHKKMRNINILNVVHIEFFISYQLSQICS